MIIKLEKGLFMSNDQELQSVLSKNPFSQELIEKWRKDLKAFNFGEIEIKDLKFILEKDDKKLLDDKNLHFELLPHPFLGTPKAPVWYLPLNPSYSEIDLYDNLGVCPICCERLTDGQIACIEGLKGWLDRGRNKLEAVMKRQEIFLNQLLFKEETFAFLEEDFNTLGECPICLDNGGYRWWKKRLFGAKNTGADYLLGNNVRSGAEVGRKLFVLEPFPYHSKKFKPSYYESSKYLEFWVELVKWGIRNGKIFIIRSRNKKFQQLKSENNITFDDHNMISLKGQNASLTRGNVEGSPETIERVCSMLSS